MWKLVKRIIFFLVAALVVFFAIALWSGGEKFRWFGERTGGVIKESSEKLGEKADVIKGKKDEAAETIKKLTGSGKEDAEDTEQAKKLVKKKKNAPPEVSTEKSKDTKNGFSLSALWNAFLEKMKTKE